MHQSSNSSANRCFKTDHQSITTLFQGEGKYLNVTGSRRYRWY